MFNHGVKITYKQKNVRREGGERGRISKLNRIRNRTGLVQFHLNSAINDKRNSELTFTVHQPQKVGFDKNLSYIDILLPQR